MKHIPYQFTLLPHFVRKGVYPLRNIWFPPSQNQKHDWSSKLGILDNIGRYELGNELDD